MLGLLPEAQGCREGSRVDGLGHGERSRKGRESEREEVASSPSHWPTATAPAPARPQGAVKGYGGASATGTSGSDQIELIEPK